jgi:branched-chain amino acid transport system substrate-binding protein
MPPNEYLDRFREKYKEDYLNLQQGAVIEMLAQAMDKARSADPKKVAVALEGMTYDYIFGPVQMRADNHQLVQPIYVLSIGKVDGKAVPRDWDRSGTLGWKEERRVEGKDTVMPTTCRMERP